MAADPGPDPGVVPGTAPCVYRGPGATLGPTPAAREVGPQPDLYREATPGLVLVHVTVPVQVPGPGHAPAPTLVPGLMPVPGLTPVSPGSRVNDRLAHRHHHRQATPTRISGDLSLGRTPSGEKETLHHR